MNNPSQKLTATGIVQSGTGTVTAFFNEIPGLLVQGNSEEDAKNKLSSLLSSYIKRLQSIGSNFDIKTESLA
jgi:hypothetical protein